MDIKAITRAYKQCPPGHVLARRSSAGYSGDYENFKYRVINNDGTNGPTLPSVSGERIAVRVRDWYYIPNAAVDAHNAQVQAEADAKAAALKVREDAFELAAKSGVRQLLHSVDREMWSGKWIRFSTYAMPDGSESVVETVADDGLDPMWLEAND